MNDLCPSGDFCRIHGKRNPHGIDCQELEELAKRDNLTGLFNDRYFYQTLEGEVKGFCAETAR